MPRFLTVLPFLAENLFGKLLGDKGYISQGMFERLFATGVRLITRLRSKMKNKLMSVIAKLLLRKRGRVDSVIQQLKGVAHIEHSRHCNLLHFIVNLLGGLASYYLCPNKPSIRLEKSVTKLLSDQSILKPSWR